jgi:hypothetical protein
MDITHQWKGRIDSETPTGFMAVIASLGGDFPLEEVEIVKSAFAGQDAGPGDTFTWAIGYETVDGARKMVSVVQVNDVPIRSTDTAWIDLFFTESRTGHPPQGDPDEFIAACNNGSDNP